MTASAPVRASDRLVFDDEAWQLAVQGDAPLVLHDRGEWLMEHPFSPPADAWLVLPLGTGARRLGVVIGGAESLPAVDSGAAAVLRLLGDLLGAGIAAAQLRQELQRTALERERMRLAAEVHDGLAQDLALAMRELALLDSGDEASRERLRAAVTSAHGTVRSRLKGMIATPGLGGLRPALEELCTRFSHRGVRVELRGDERLPEVGAGGRRRGAARALGGAHQRRAPRRRRARRDRRARVGRAARARRVRRRPGVRRPSPGRRRGTSGCCSCASARTPWGPSSWSTARPAAAPE